MFELTLSVKLTAAQIAQLARAAVWLAVLLVT